MSYNRDHVVRFLDASATSAEQDERILARANAAIDDPADELSGKFSASKLDEVLGDPELIVKFNEMWNTGQLVD